MTVVANVENLLYGSRSLVGFTEEGDYVSSWPELTHESLRAINHLTSHGPIPAPTLYRVLGELKGIVAAFVRALRPRGLLVFTLEHAVGNGDVDRNLLVGGEQADVGIDTRGLLVEIAGSDMRIVA